MQDELQIGNIGSVIVIRVVEDESPVDISGVNGKFIRMKPPSGATVEHTAEFVTNGTDGLMRYVTTSTDLPAGSHGQWYVQGKITYASGNVFYTEVLGIKVRQNI